MCFFACSQQFKAFYGDEELAFASKILSGGKKVRE